jgi:hypothetical protein
MNRQTLINDAPVVVSAIGALLGNEALFRAVAMA